MTRIWPVLIAALVGVLCWIGLIVLVRWILLVKLPGDLESEAQVLGSLLVNPGLFAEVSGIIGADDFSASRNRMAYGLLEAFQAEGTPVDPTVFNQRLPFRNDEPMYTANLLDAVIAPSSAPYHARRVRDAARLRFLALAGRDISDQACAPDAKLEPVLTQAEHAVFAASHGVTDDVSWDQALANTLDRIEHHYQTGNTLDGLSTGLQSIDSLLGGVQPGWLIYIGARPAVGKTALALQVAIDVAREGHRVMVCSLEMSTEELARRAICRLSGISYSRVAHNQMTEQDWSRFVRSKDTLAGLPIDLFDNDIDTVPAIASRVRRLAPELVIIDYVQLMREPAKNRNEEIGLISRGLKLLARETEYSIIAPVQLNRSPEARADKRPTISDLRESGSLEQDADVVILLSRQGESGTTTTLDLAKYRHGPSGRATIGWDPTTTRFYDLY